MKKTFNYYTSIVALNHEHRKFLLKYAINKEVPVYEDTRIDTIDEQFPNLSWQGECLAGTLATPASRPKREWITTDKWIEYCDNWAELQSVKIALNESYIAEIDKANKIVKVGCQSFPFSKIEELYKAIQR